MKKIKFPLVMKDGTEVRDIEAFREHFDIESAVEYYSNGKLERWLKNYYYDDILENVQKLAGNEPDFGELLAEALGVEWKSAEKMNLQNIMKRTELKEQLKPYVSEEQLEGMEHIADTQEELEQLVRSGCSSVYLFGKTFSVLEWMENVELIGIGQPVVNLEIKSREEFQKKKIKLRDVGFATEEMKKVALVNSETAVYYSLLDTLKLYLESVQKIIGQENRGGEIS